MSSVAYAQTRVSFDIPAQALDAALLQYAEQAHVSLALPAQLPRARSNPVHGDLTPEQALGRLLADTGLSYQAAGEGAFRVTLSRRHAAAAVPAPITSDEIIITAARRDIALSEIPRSIGNIDGDRLQQLPIGDSRDLTRQVSGLQFTDVGAGRDKIYMRGVSDGALTGSAQSTVSIYLDGVRLTYAAPDPQLRLIDVARIDVLRGPQGALYGAGSIGGILSIESNLPDPSEFSGAFMLGGESVRASQTGHQSELVLNAPIFADRVAVRLAAYDEEMPGWLDNAVTGATDTNQTRRRGGRISALWNVTPDWSLRAFGVTQAIRANDMQYLTVTPSGPMRMASVEEPYEDDFSSNGVTLSGRSSIGSVESTTAFVRHEISSLFDATGSFASFGIDPLQPRTMTQRDVLNILVHETRLIAPRSATIPWVLGAFYANGETQSSRFLPDGALAAYALQRRDAITEAAIFGEATWPLTQRLSLSTGLRLFQLDVDVEARTHEALLGLNTLTTGRSTRTDYAPDIRLSYELSDDVRFYVGAAEGYRSGGFNVGEPIGAPFGAGGQPARTYAGDELWTYEAGARLALFEHRLQVSAAIFYNSWERIQTDSLIVDNLPYTGNVGRGRALGFEADALYAPTERLTLRTHLLLNDTEVDQSDPTFPLASRAFPGVPDFAITGSARYEQPLHVWSGAEARLFAELSVAYTGSSTAGFSSTTRQDGYAVADLTLGVNLERTDLMLYARNLTDSDGATFSLANAYAPGRQITQLRPATIGAQVRYRF